MRLLILGRTYPEPQTTAAGSRMMQLISVFKEQGYEIHFASGAQINQHSIKLELIGVETNQIELNSPSFDDYLRRINPDIVLFDRYIMEEYYGWRVASICPQALRILDTEDLHFLRSAREKTFKKTRNLDNLDLYTDTAKREIASILRCDCSLIISEYEYDLLTNQFKIPKEILHYVPFMVESEEIPKVYEEYSQREGFMTIGNLLHTPNIDSVLYLKQQIWPIIRRKLPEATLSIYGNYASQHILETHNENEGFLIKGWAPSAMEVMSKSRVCLAPLRFGAGLKGKLMDAMLYSTPSVTTSIGAEGMYGKMEHKFAISDDPSVFAQMAIDLYQDNQLWNIQHKIAKSILNERFNRTEHKEVLFSEISKIKADLTIHRNQNFVGQILQHHTMQSTKYLSKWIEEKNKKESF